jgi:hypothetical protein
LAVPLTPDGKYAGRLALWIDDVLRRAVPPRDTLDTTLIDALSGAPSPPGSPPIVWEGQAYRLDLAAAERRRLELVRERQGRTGIETAVLVARSAQVLGSPARSPDVASVRDALQSAVASFPPVEPDLPASEVVPSPRLREVLSQAADTAGRLARAFEPGAAARTAQALSLAADDLAADALVTFAYAIDLGDPDGPALLANDISRRHDLGVTLNDEAGRARERWSVPEHRHGSGVPWHVAGSLLGLDLALAPLALRRLNPNRMLDEPAVPAVEGAALALGHALHDPLAEDASPSETIAAALAGGRQRLASIANLDALDEVAVELQMDGWRRRAAAWTLRHEPPMLERLFSLTELVALGSGSTPLRLDRWGMSALASSGCVCTELVPAARWPLLVGRPEGGILAVTLGDLNLHVAVTLTELALPATLSKQVLGAAFQDYLDDVRLTDPNDWLGRVQAMRSISRDRIEDYVAAAAAAGGPLVPFGEGEAISR